MSIARLIGIDVPRLRRRGGVAMVAGAIAAVMVTLAVAFAAFAGYIALARRFDMETAALIVAGVLLFIGLIALVIARQMLKRARREMRAAVSSSAIMAFAPTAASMAARHTRLAAVVAAVGMGFWLARNVTRR
ncbi:phage holin family protein [Pleomorphomonas oryzae]|uniref:phage holin family protein n=1 Tax=Pleomorphomonas oryzae TaxID=261934 RepID=UPI0012EB67EC|nr:phage holin family protein [Pleomorphomonas oryzae]